MSLFRDLLSQLHAEHSRVEAEVAVLREEIGMLRLPVATEKSWDSVDEFSAAQEGYQRPATHRLPSVIHRGRCEPGVKDHILSSQTSTAYTNAQPIEVSGDDPLDDITWEDDSRRHADIQVVEAVPSREVRVPATTIRTMATWESADMSRSLRIEDADKSWETQKKHSKLSTRSCRTNGSQHTNFERQGGPQGVCLWPDWEAEEKVGPCENANLNRLTSTASFCQRIAVRSGDTMTSDGCVGYLMTGPSSPRRIMWDLLSFIIMGYDVLMIPMSAFELPPTRSLLINEWIVSIFWTVDILATFLVGYYDAGILELRPRIVARRYMRSWFFPDLCIVCVDWIVISIGSTTSEGSALGVLRIGKSVRMIRILRMFRLLRILKIVALLEEVTDFIHSESLHTTLQIVKLVVAIVVIAHFLACGWYAVGVASAVYEMDTWVLTLERSVGFDVGLDYKYSSSLHWSLTQFTPASMEIVPCNPYERIYSILVILLALVLFSTFVSSITSSMTRLGALRDAQRKQADNIRKYIQDNKLSMELGNRMHAFLRTSLNVKTRIHEQDIPLFKFLPENLRLQMRSEVYCPRLLMHPFFAVLDKQDSGAVFGLSGSAMSEKSLVIGEELFTIGQKASMMYFLVSGSAEYYHGVGESYADQVREGHRICEIVLWSPWEHQGRLLAEMTAEFVCIDSAKFRTMARRRRLSYNQCAQYAVEYIQRFVDCCGGLENLTDIWENKAVLEDMARSSFPDVMYEPPYRNSRSSFKMMGSGGSLMSMSSAMSSSSFHLGGSGARST